ncbi:hypothetical protein B8W90_13370, partial [Staphylococcus hominis]
IEKGLGKRWYAVLFALSTVIGCGLLLPGTQSNAMVSALDEAWGAPGWVTAAGIGTVVAMVIFGGVRRIAQVAQVIV